MSNHGIAELRLTYDREADVLYVTIRPGLPARSVEAAPGLILRYDFATGEPVGATVIDFSSYWRTKLDGLAELIGDHFRTPRRATYEVLRGQF